MDVDDANAVVAPQDRARVLRLIEAGAKAKGDLGIANDARYALEALESGDDALWRRIPNLVFYRLAAGYFVRPFHPIAALLVLVGLVSLFRAARVRDTSSSLVGRAWARLCIFWQEFLDALALIGRGGGEARQSRRLEAFVYRLLVVCVLIGLANSNPTLREMFDAVV